MKNTQLESYNCHLHRASDNRYLLFGGIYSFRLDCKIQLTEAASLDGNKMTVFMEAVYRDIHVRVLYMATDVVAD